MICHTLILVYNRIYTCVGVGVSSLFVHLVYIGCSFFFAFSLAGATDSAGGWCLVFLRYLSIKHQRSCPTKRQIEKRVFYLLLVVSGTHKTRAAKHTTHKTIHTRKHSRISASIKNHHYIQHNTSKIEHRGVNIKAARSRASSSFNIIFQELVPEQPPPSPTTNSPTRRYYAYMACCLGA